MTSSPNPSVLKCRQRRADQIAQHLAWTAATGLSYDDTAEWAVRIADEPVLQRILHEAPELAAAAPDALRVARTPRGHMTVLRLHGPGWSLILTPGCPLPGCLLVVLDTYLDIELPMSMLDPDWTPEIAAMTAAILAAADRLS